jgi:RNA polymerase sigma-70 factor (ECF subfamily)
MGQEDRKRTFVDRLDRHRAILFRVAATYCSNPSDREELAQEIVAQMWRSYPKFDRRSSFSTWMYRIAANVAISFLRSETRKRRRVVLADASLLERIPDSPEPKPDDRLSLLYELIDSLDPLERTLMLLYLDDRPHSEIAVILGLSESNVGTKVARIKERFKRSIADSTAS